MSDTEDRQKATEEQLDNQVRTPGEEVGQTEVREPEKPDVETPTFPEPSGTDNGLPNSEVQVPAGSGQVAGTPVNPAYQSDNQQNQE